MSGILGQSKKGGSSLFKCFERDLWKTSWGRLILNIKSLISRVEKFGLKLWCVIWRETSEPFIYAARETQWVRDAVRPNSLGYCGRKWRCWWKSAKVYPKDQSLASRSGYTERSDEHMTVALQYCCWNNAQLYRSRATGEIPGWCNSSVSPQ
jgi:hypothetical protein